MALIVRLTRNLSGCSTCQPELSFRRTMPPPPQPQQQVDPQVLIKQQQQQFQQQVEMKTLEMIIEKCAQKCTTNKGGRLDRGEQQCVANCYDRYFEARKIIMNEMQGSE